MALRADIEIVRRVIVEDITREFAEGLCLAIKDWDVGRDTPAVIYAEWQALQAKLDELHKSADPTQDTPPEVTTLEAEVEAAGTKLAASKPRTHADAIAMMEWADSDSDGGNIDSPLYDQARKAVIEYLKRCDGFLSK